MYGTLYACQTVVKRNSGNIGKFAISSDYLLKSGQMFFIRHVWTLVQGDPKFMQSVNGWLTVVWMAMIPIALLTGWIESVPFIAAISLYANLAGHWSAWQASRVEVKQDEVKVAKDAE